MSAEKPTESLAESRMNNRRMRRRRDLQDSTATASVPSTPKNKQIDADYSHKQSKEATASSNIVTNGSTTFGEDFIPFVISDPSDDDEPGPSRRRRTDRTNDRQRESDKKSDRDGDDTTVRERQAMSKSDQVPTSDHVQGRLKMAGSEREWDRGKDVAARDDKRNGHGRDRKRKYDEYDDGYSNHKRRVEVGSRKCPWVTHLDLNHCSNVAEMWVKFDVQQILKFSL
jgi:hypothetical protein